ncbi:MAG: dolichyl-phosphate-mannose--protein mannosyltransferase [Actinomycetota bacterium]
MLGDQVGARAANWARSDWIALTTVTLVGGILRLIRVADPPSYVFDEVYYAKDACWYVNTSSSLCEIDIETTQVHPPLGKWLIAVGVRLFGFDSFGWRISAVVAGTITIALLYLLARRILRSTLGATIAAGLLAIDLLHFVQSRISMLDIFVAMFGVAAFLFVVYDRDRLLPALQGAEDEEEVPRRGLIDRPWRLAAGIVAGAAVASKWSGGFILLGVIILTIAWEIAARRADGKGRVLARLLREEGLSISVWLIAVPLIVYGLTFIGRVDGTLLTAPWSHESWFRALWERHQYMYDFHSGLTDTHSYQSPAWSWLLLKRPVSYFFNGDGGDYREILATGSPFVWWASTLALAYVAYSWVRERNATGAQGLILLGFTITYGPWLIPFFARDAIFMFYLLPSVPFMCLALGWVAARIGRSWEARAAHALFAATAIGLFAFYYPLLTKVAISQEDWDRRIWVFDNCDPSEATTTSTITTTVGTQVTTQVTESPNTSVPPEGWCWI